MSWLWGTSGNSYGGASVASLFSSLNKVDLQKDQQKAAQIVQALKEKAEREDIKEPLGKGLHIVCDKLIASAECDYEIQLNLIQVLLISTSSEPENEDYIALINSQIIIGHSEGAALQHVVSLLTDQHFHKRYYACQLLLQLCRNGKVLDLQRSIISSPEGPPVLFDLLNDTREALRDLALDLVYSIANDHHDLRQMGAYSNAFENLFEIIDSSSELAAKALQLMRCLLEGHSSNQTHFRETGCASKLVTLLAIEPSDYMILTDAKEALLLGVLSVIECLVGGSTPAARQNRVSLVKALPQLTVLALSRLPNASVRIQALCVLGASLRGNSESVALLAQSNVELQPTSQASDAMRVGCLERLTRIAIEAQTVDERRAALQCWRDYLWRNQPAQLALAESVCSGGKEIGSDLIEQGIAQGGIAALGILSASLEECQVAQQQYLRSKDTFDSLIGAIVRANSNSEFTLVFYLIRFLVCWLYRSPECVQVLASTPSAVPALVECVMSPLQEPHSAALAAIALGICSTSTKDISVLISSRIGSDKFLGRIRYARKSKQFEGAEDDIRYDQFLKVVLKRLLDQLSRTFEGGVTDDDQDLGSSVGTTEDTANLLSSYKEVIRQQDAELELLKAKVKEMESQLETQKESGDALGILQKRDARLRELEADNERLLVLLADQEMELTKLKRNAK